MKIQVSICLIGVFDKSSPTFPCKTGQMDQGRSTGMPQRYCRFNRAIYLFAGGGPCLRFVKDATSVRHNKVRHKQARNACKLNGNNWLCREEKNKKALIRSFCHLINTLTATDFKLPT